MEEKVVLGVFTHDDTLYLPTLVASHRRFLSKYPLEIVVCDGTIAENMTRLWERFVKSGARWCVYLDHDIRFMSGDTIEVALAAARRNGWAVTTVNSTYDWQALERPYAEVNAGVTEVARSWCPGYFMLVDMSKVGQIIPETVPDCNGLVDVAFCAAVRQAGHRLGMAAATVHHVDKGVREFPDHVAGREYLIRKYGRFFADPFTPPEVEQVVPGKMRFHVLGLAYLPTDPLFSPCAFTSKLLGLCKMLKSLGHEVVFYGAEGSIPEADEVVTCITEDERVAVYGKYDWHREMFRFGDPLNDVAHKIFNARAVEAIQARKRPGDFLVCQVGYYHQPVADAAGQGMIVVEPGIGHGGTFAPYRVYESYTWMHYMYGTHRIEDGPWYDAVIPGYYDPEQFPYREQKDDYFLYIGRIVKRKGVEVAIQIAQALGKKLIMAGQGDLNSESEGLHLDPLPEGVEWVGAVEIEERARLMGGAIAVLMPTIYIEPFGAVAVEAQMCGTPIITTDWGAFPETVKHGVTGYRCRTFDDFLFAGRQCIAGIIKPQACRAWAEQNFSIHRIKWMYQEYFSRLRDLWTDPQGWYVQHPDRQNLDWLRKYHADAENTERRE